MKAVYVFCALLSGLNGYISGSVTEQQVRNICVLTASSGIGSYIWKKCIKVSSDRPFRKSTPEELEKDRIKQQFCVHRYAADKTSIFLHSLKQKLYYPGAIVLPLAGALVCSLVDPAPSNGFDFAPQGRFILYCALSSCAAYLGNRTVN
jgi:hypothetical protein